MLKRASMLLCAVLLAAALAPRADAAGWEREELGWVKTNSSHVGGRPADTTWTVLASKTLKDTTGMFSLNDAELARIGQIAGTAVAGTREDSLVAGFVEIMSDTAIATPNTLEGLLLSLEGRVGGYGLGTGANAWVAVDTTSVPATEVLNASGIITVAIKPFGNLGGNVFRYSNLRYRVTSPSAGKLPGARIFVKTYKP